METVICRSCSLVGYKEKMKSLEQQLELDTAVFDIPCDLSILDLYQYCTQLGARIDDGLPQNVCSVCVKKLIGTYEYLKSCEATETKLRNTVMTDPNKHKMFDCMKEITFDDIIAVVKEEDEESTLTVQAIETTNPTIEEHMVVGNSEEVYELETPIETEVLSNSDESLAAEESFLRKTGVLKSKTTSLPSEDELIKEENTEPEFLDPEYLEEIFPDTTISKVVQIECNICKVVLPPKAYIAHFEEEHSQKKVVNVKTVPCLWCERNFTQKYLEKHMSTNHSEQTKTEKCSIDGCQEAFFLERTLQLHQQRVHSKPMAKKSEITRLCPVCGEKFTDRRLLYLHERQHDGYNERTKKRADCTICGVSITVKDMKGHMRRHTGERPYICKTCGQSFAQNGTMRTHELRHKTQRPYPCPMCDKTFARPAMLIIHKRSHTGERPFACDLCTKTFARKDLLVIHKRKHSGHKPYQCDLCPRSFHVAAMLNEHRYSHQEDQLRCSQCPETFTYPKHLNKHLKEKHNIDVKMAVIIENENEGQIRSLPELT